MCGRFVDPDLRGTEVEHSELKIDPIPRRFNVKPTEQILLLAKVPLQAMYARWWLVPSWHRGDLKDWKATTFNARIEDARTRPTFRAAWKNGRCLIPAAGYFEWTGQKGHRLPHFIASATNEQTLWVAGLASRWEGLLTCAMLTRAANDAVQAVHTRMPVILNGEEREAWLGGSEDLSIGKAARLRHHRVAPFGPRDDGPGLIEPVDAT